MRNGENDLVVDMTAKELIARWDAVCEREDTSGACLPSLEQFETYFAVGARSHFCLIPVDEETISKYQEAGTEIRQQ